MSTTYPHLSLLPSLLTFPSLITPEWQIIRLGSSMAFDKATPAIPRYAPFVAAGFFFGPASFLHEVRGLRLQSHLLTYTLTHSSYTHTQSHST